MQLIFYTVLKSKYYLTIIYIYLTYITFHIVLDGIQTVMIFSVYVDSISLQKMKLDSFKLKIEIY